MNFAIASQSRAYDYRRQYRQLAKRFVDMLLSILLIPFVAPIIVACAVAIALDSPGPVFFTQERIGKDGKRFKIYKFRTMYHKLDDSSHRAFMKAFVRGQIGGEGTTSGQVFKPAQDAQITRVGRILRKTSLDELPQILNILRGEMSLVGPRPNVPWEVEEYKPWHYERLEVLPGITGLAQVRGRSGISFDRIVQYDIEYIERQNLILDFQIIWWTFSTVLRGAGAK